MKNLSIPRFAPLALGLSLAVLATACGKNMSLALKPPANSNPAADIQTTPKSNLGNPDTDGKLQTFSVFDVNDLLINRDDAYPFLNGGAKILHLGDASGGVQKSNLVFRAIKRIPDPKLVDSIVNFELVLNGVSPTQLSHQVLCLVDETHSCTGDPTALTDAEKSNLNPQFWAKADVESNLFSQIAVQGQAPKDIKINLLTAFAIDKLGVADQMQWLLDHSQPYTDNGYRKFRFVVGNNVYIHDGQMNLQFNLKTGANDNAEAASSTLINGSTDSIDGSSVTAPVTKAATVADPAPKPESKLESKPESQPTDKIIVPGQIVMAIQNPSQDDKHADIELNLYDKVLYFKTNSAAARKTDGAKVASSGGVLLDQKDYLGAIYITGVTSVTGTKKRNNKLGMSRAIAVANYFAVSGLNKSIMQTANRLTITSSCAPVRECDKDRRVEVKIRLSDKLNQAKMDPALRSQIRDQLVAKLKGIWENNVQIQE